MSAMGGSGAAGGIMAGAGALMHIGGTWLAAGQADARKKELKNIANMPGVDIGAATGESLANYQKYLAEATGISGAISQANQAQLSARGEQALPGVTSARAAQMGRIQSLFGNDAAQMKEWQRLGAGLGLRMGGTGYAGSQAGQIGTLNQTMGMQKQNWALGSSLLTALISGTPLASTPGVQAFLGPNPSETVAIRSGERQRQQQMLAQAAGLPTGTEEWANSLKEAGSVLIGSGMSMGMGGGGGASAMTGRAQPAFTMSDYSGGANPVGAGQVYNMGLDYNPIQSENNFNYTSSGVI